MDVQLAREKPMLRPHAISMIGQSGEIGPIGGTGRLSVAEQGHDNDSVIPQGITAKFSLVSMRPWKHVTTKATLEA